MNTENRLSEEDQNRVDQVINRGYNSVERKPFNGWALAAVCATVVVLLGLIARGIAVSEGYIGSFF